MRVFVSRQPWQCLLFVVSLIAAILIDVSWYSQLWLWILFPWCFVTLSTFSCVCWPSVGVPRGKCLFLTLCPVKEVFIDLWLQPSLLLQRLLSRCAWAAPGGGFSCCGAPPPGCLGSVAVGSKLSCSTSCGIFLNQGSNPCPCIGRQILHHWTTREVCPLPTFYLFAFLVLSSVWDV